MDFLRRAVGMPDRLAVLSAAFHPVTRAHMALAEVALERADEVLFVLPQAFPHKEYDAITIEDRLEIVLAATAHETRFSVAVSDGGLFIDIARECRPAYLPRTRMAFLCGADAADRIVNWDYGEAGAFAKMLEEFELWVFGREREYEPPEALERRIHTLQIPDELRAISGTEVRRRIAARERWEHMVPPSAIELIRGVYRG